MAQALIIEEESGTCRGRVHPHNGYYAGDFSSISSIGPGAADPRHLHAVVDPQSGTTTAAEVLFTDWPHAA